MEHWSWGTCTERIAKAKAPLRECVCLRHAVRFRREAVGAASRREELLAWGMV